MADKMETDEPQPPTAEGFQIPIQLATEQEEANAASQNSGKKQGGRSNQSIKGRAKARGRAQPVANISTAEGTVGASVLNSSLQAYGKKPSSSLCSGEVLGSSPASARQAELHGPALSSRLCTDRDQWQQASDTHTQKAHQLHQTTISQPCRPAWPHGRLPSWANPTDANCWHRPHKSDSCTLNPHQSRACRAPNRGSPHGALSGSPRSQRCTRTTSTPSPSSTRGMMPLPSSSSQLQRRPQGIPKVCAADSLNCPCCGV